MQFDSENRGHEFLEVERLAVSYMKHPHEMPKAQSLAAWKPIVLLWDFPSFRPYRSWGIFQRRERRASKDLSLVRQITWDRGADAERLSNPLTGLREGFHVQPTLEVRDRPLDTARLERFLDELRSISFPAFCAQGFGIDGDIFGVAYPQLSLSVEWWCEGPASWEALTHWAYTMREWLSEVTAAPPSEYASPPVRPKLP